jgi:chemotaxis protein methyltransferase CheR
MAITARESLPDPSWKISVRGVDINPVMLERARRARFAPWALREASTVQHRWLREEGRDLVLDESIRRAVQFEQRNLSRDDPELWQTDFYDVVFCRNVIMYFTPESARVLIGRITRSLAPGGYLFLDHAETLRGVSQDFHLRQSPGTFYYQRKNAGELAAARPVEAVAVQHLRGPLLSTFDEGTTSWIEAIPQTSEEVKAFEHGPGMTVPATPPLALKPDLDGALDLLQRERFADALDIVHGFPLESASDPDVLMLEAVLLTHSGQLKQARETCERLLLIDERSAEAHYALALCREAEGDRRVAGDCDHVAIYLDPTFAMPRLHLGLLARRAGDFDAARRELGQAQLLLQREDASRLLLFGGGFGREALIALCAAELNVCGVRA